MVAAFPVAKLGFLLIKQVAKPIAKGIAARAKNSRIFRDYVCIPIAQGFHWYEIKLKMMTMDLGGKVTKVPKLNEAKAIEQGSEILSEFIILSIASGILIFEYNRSKEKEEAKEEGLRIERERIKHKIFELEFKVEKQHTQIRELARTAIHLEEELHKRSLKRIFEQKPKLNPELLETASQPDVAAITAEMPEEYMSDLVKTQQQPQQAVSGGSIGSSGATGSQQRGVVSSATGDILDRTTSITPQQEGDVKQQQSPAQAEEQQGRRGRSLVTQGLDHYFTTVKSSSSTSSISSRL